MRRLNSYFLNLSATDLTVVIFYFILTGLNLIYYSVVHPWMLLVLMNAAVITFVFSIAYLDKKAPDCFWKYIHYWYLVPLILLTFKELYLMVHPIRHYDYDFLLIAADRFIFGTDPTEVLDKIANPFLTELLQIVYGTFYFLPIILGVALMRKRKYAALDFSMFCIVYGFFLSYMGYFILPGVGPRFTLHNFSNINKDLPGLWLTNFLREVVNIGESIPAGTKNPMSVVQRDVFPSGHTEMTLITMYLAVKFNSRAKYFLLPTGALLIFATVYLRYHYFIDLVGGLIFMIFTIWSGKYIYNKWQKITHKKEFSYKEVTRVYQLSE